MMTAFGLPMWICLVWLFVFGTVVGSFLNVCIYRIPTKEGLLESLHAIVFPASRCPKCQNRIPGWANVPIFGWLVLRGRCYHCQLRISMRYPLIELFNGLLWVFLYWVHIPGEYFSNINQSWVHGVYGPVGSIGHHVAWWQTNVALLHWQFLYHLVLVEALLVASFIDIDLRIIPDGSTLPAMLFGLLGSLTGFSHLTPVWHQDSVLRNDMRWLAPWIPEWVFPRQAVPEWIAAHAHLHGFAVSMVGIAIGGGLTWIFRIIGKWGLGREAIGFGDVILMAMIGAFLGWQATVLTFFIAPAIALVVTIVTWPLRRESVIPYGPFLSIGAIVVMSCWRPLWQSYSRIFGAGPLLVLVAVAMLAMFALSTRLVWWLKRCFGWRDSFDEMSGEWTAADQNFYLACENVDPHHGRWPTSHEWPGSLSARGWSHYDTWRHGPKR